MCNLQFQLKSFFLFLRSCFKQSARTIFLNFDYSMSKRYVYSENNI